MMRRSGKRWRARCGEEWTCNCTRRCVLGSSELEEGSSEKRQGTATTLRSQECKAHSADTRQTKQRNRRKQAWTCTFCYNKEGLDCGLWSDQPHVQQLVLQARPFTRQVKGLASN